MEACWFVVAAGMGTGLAPVEEVGVHGLTAGGLWRLRRA